MLRNGKMSANGKKSLLSMEERNIARKGRQKLMR
jgi:hypothetical protein